MYWHTLVDVQEIKHNSYINLLTPSLPSLSYFARQGKHDFAPVDHVFILNIYDTGYQYSICCMNYHSLACSMGSMCDSKIL